METQGAAWGARRDVIDRAKFNLTQSIETIVDGCAPEGPLEIEASFDEFSLDLRVSYAGPPLELPDQRPSNEEIMASEEGQRRQRHHAHALALAVPHQARDPDRQQQVEHRYEHHRHDQKKR